MLNLYYLTKFSKWISQNRNIEFNDFPSKWDYKKRFDLYNWIIKKESLEAVPLNYLEFGVAQGESFRWFLQKNTHPTSSYNGFDTFTGLPEDFGVYKKGMFNNNNEPPKVNDNRANFHQGLFQQTLPQFLPKINTNNRNFILLDADLFSATLYVLTSLAPYLKKGDLILFDEFSVPTHEFRAYDEFTQSFPIKLELVAAANNYYFTAFKVS